MGESPSFIDILKDMERCIKQNNAIEIYEVGSNKIFRQARAEVCQVMLNLKLAIN